MLYVDSRILVPFATIVFHLRTALSATGFETGRSRLGLPRDWLLECLSLANASQDRVKRRQVINTYVA